MRNGVKYYRTIGSAEMETFLEKAGYTTMTINQIIKEIDTLCAQLELDTKAYLIFASQKNDKS